MEIITPEDTARAFIHAIDKQEAISKRVSTLVSEKAVELVTKIIYPVPLMFSDWEKLILSNILLQRRISTVDIMQLVMN